MSAVSNLTAEMESENSLKTMLLHVAKQRPYIYLVRKRRLGDVHVSTLSWLQWLLKSKVFVFSIVLYDYNRLIRVYTLNLVPYVTCFFVVV